MANFKITATTTVAELKEQFHNEFGGVLRVYQGRSEAPEDATLVSLGGKVGELECRASRTVGKFIEAFQSELGLKVKVYTKDNWVSVLDGITLATVREIPKNARKAQMEQFLAYQRDEKEEDNADNNSDEEDEYILFISESDDVKIESRDETQFFILKKGENKAYIEKYPFLRDGFRLHDDSYGLTGIDFNHVSRLKIKNMQGMFKNALNLKKLDLSNIDTSELKKTSYLFGCGVEELNLSGWDLSHFEYGVDDLFDYADNLSVVIAHGCNSETICGIKSAIKANEELKDKGVTIISDLEEDINNINSNNSNTMSDKYDGYRHINVDEKDNETIGMEIGYFAEENEGDFAVVVVAGDLKLYVEGHLYVNSRGGDGELDYIKVLEGELSEEDQREIEDKFSSMVSWT